MDNVNLDAYAINDDYYTWTIRAYETVRNRLGLNLKVHPDDEPLKQGHIFLFNHFARFETVIPPYIIYRATGVHTRSVADKGLFEASPGLSKFLRGVGAMPNKLPGLLAFLAAEVLKGRKIVMFPEGGMVKDRRVLDSDGEIGVFSATANKHRKHHRGAAVLALTLDIFKQRILDLHNRDDHERIGRWVTALGLDDAQQLLARAREPTLIVPATITFYPIRVEENFLSQAVNLFARGLPDQVAEEMLVEGNLIFRDTDMDIRLNPPVQPTKIWRWWEIKLLNDFFRSVSSLDELFSLRDRAENWSDRILARCISKETVKIRDQYTLALYTGTTVNLSHLASCLIMSLIQQGRMEIAINDFHKALYLATKRLQTAHGVFLHRSLNWPDRYRGLLDGDCPELDRFLATCKDAGLVGRVPGTYRFLDKLLKDYHPSEIRVENPVHVYANEAAPISEVGETVESVRQDINAISERRLARHLFDDELRAHAWNREHYSQEEHRAVNATETATRSGAPYLLIPEQDARRGVLLVHGFLASPAELSAFGHRLYRDGYAVMGTRLAGHGTSPWDLKSRTWREWLGSVRRGYRILSAFVDEIIIVGFSAGGALSLMLAAEHPKKLGAVVSVSAPLIYRNRKLAFVPLVHGLNRLAGWLPSFEGIMPFRENDSEHPDINYHNIPIHGLYQMRAMTNELQDHLSAVEVPALIIQGDDDPVVEPESARMIFNKIGSDDKALHWIGAARHGIFNEDIGGTCDLVRGFVDKACTETGAWSRHNPPPSPPAKPAYEILDEAVSRRPGQTCLHFLGQDSSYGDIGNMVIRAAKGLQNLGIEKGDRVGLCLPNCPYYVIAYFAALKVGATVVNFNPLYTADEIRNQIVDSGAVIMITLDLKDIYPKIEAALDCTSLRSVVVCSLSDALPPFKELMFNTLKRRQIVDIGDDIRNIPFEKLVLQGANPEAVEIDPANDIAVIQYTGGTTGVPKGAMLTHANIVANAEQVRLWAGGTDPAGERMLCAIPFFHVFAMTVAMNLGLSLGSELILLPKFELGSRLIQIQ